jgi:hypothetical protein
MGGIVIDEGKSEIEGRQNSTDTQSCAENEAKNSNFGGVFLLTNLRGGGGRE